MIWACVIDFCGDWVQSLALEEFSYNNHWHSSIQVAPFEAFYGIRWHSLIGWFLSLLTYVEIICKLSIWPTVYSTLPIVDIKYMLINGCGLYSSWLLIAYLCEYCKWRVWLYHRGGTRFDRWSLTFLIFWGG